jgi:hypothetical protein
MTAPNSATPSMSAANTIAVYDLTTGFWLTRDRWTLGHRCGR